jgi:steroid Delta-isomerase
MSTSKLEETRRASAARLAAAIESAHTDEAAALLGCCVETLRFEDPISRVNGRAGLKRVMDHTWRVSPPGARFKVRQQALVGDKIYTRWSLVREKAGKELSLVEAVGESTLDEQGCLIHHVDYWDSVQAFYSRIPLLGRLLERIRRAVSVGWEPPAMGS